MEFDFLKDYFPPDKWANIVLIVIATLAATQALKLAAKAFNRMPGDGEVKLLSLVCALVFTYFQWPVSEMVSNIAIAFVAWFLSVGVATYGLMFLKEFAPKVYRVVNFDRRKFDKGPPKKTKERRC